MDFQKAEKCAKNLVSQMTAEEKMSQLLYNSPAIERLGINEYNWWNEACHGVARAGVATVFPQSIALGATFNPALINSVADAISTEGRAKYNSNIEFGDRGIYKGVTYWTPNINIFRDPRWGRGQETFGEDPFLTAAMGCSFVKGIQGDGEFYKATACVKHLAAHSGPESQRHYFNAKVSDKDLFETYLPAFEKAVESGVAGVMGAYNRVNGAPSCANIRLIRDILRKRWNFKGYFVSDCGAIKDIYENHKYVESKSEAAAVALKAGCELNCGEAYKYLIDAYEEDLVSDEDITDAAVSVFTIRALLGEFEEKRPFSDIPYSKLCCKEHRDLNLESAKQSLVLLKNENSFLPIDKNSVKSIAVIGPNAMSRIALEGNYNGHADEYVTVADGIRKVFDLSSVTVADGSGLYFDKSKYFDGFVDLESEAAAVASGAQLTVLCLGLDRTAEGEDLGCETEFQNHGDRKTMHLPDIQMRLAEKLCEVSENLVIITMCGSGVDLTEKVRSRAKAIIHAWYPGALGGLAIARLLAGDFSPSGKLPITFYSEDADIPDITDYNIQGRTYRFIAEKPLYPFGYGLSYADVEYTHFSVESIDDDKIEVCISLKNNSKIKTVEKLQIYAKYSDSRTTTPNYQLCAVLPVQLEANEAKTVKTAIDRYWIKAVLPDGSRVEPNGGITLFAGSHQPDDRSRELCADDCLEAKV